MWRLVLGLGVLLQTGAVRADEAAAARTPEACPADQRCDVDEPGVPAEAPAATRTAPPSDMPAVPSAVAAVPSQAAQASHDAFATVSFRNDVGTKLRLVEARFTMDGGDRQSVIVSPEPGRSYVIVNGPVAPGPHVMTTHLVYQGDRRVFTYMNGYRINVAADKILTAPADGAVSVTIVGAENRGMNVPFEKRLVVKVEQGAPAIRK